MSFRAALGYRGPSRNFTNWGELAWKERSERAKELQQAMKVVLGEEQGAFPRTYLGKTDLGGCVLTYPKLWRAPAGTTVADKQGRQLSVDALVSMQMRELCDCTVAGADVLASEFPDLDVDYTPGVVNPWHQLLQPTNTKSTPNRARLLKFIGDPKTQQRIDFCWSTRILGADKSVFVKDSRGTDQWMEFDTSKLVNTYLGVDYPNPNRRNTDDSIPPLPDNIPLVRWYKNMPNPCGYQRAVKVPPGSNLQALLEDSAEKLEEFDARGAEEIRKAVTWQRPVACEDIAQWQSDSAKARDQANLVAVETQPMNPQTFPVDQNPADQAMSVFENKRDLPFKVGKSTAPWLPPASAAYLNALNAKRVDRRSSAVSGNSDIPSDVTLKHNLLLAGSVVAALGAGYLVHRLFKGLR